MPLVSLFGVGMSYAAIWRAQPRSMPQRWPRVNGLVPQPKVKTEVTADVDALKALLEDADADKDALVAAITKLGESSQKMGAALYATDEAAAAEGGTEATEGDDDIVEAEIVDEAGEGEEK